MNCHPTAFHSQRKQGPRDQVLARCYEDRLTDFRVSHFDIDPLEVGVLLALHDRQEALEHLRDPALEGLIQGTSGKPRLARKNFESMLFEAEQQRKLFQMKVFCSAIDSVKFRPHRSYLQDFSAV